VITAILLGLAPRRRIGPAMRFFDLLFYGYIGATPQILVSGALIDFHLGPWRVVGCFSRFLSADAQIFISQFDYRGLKTPYDKPLLPLFVRHGQAAEAEARGGFRAISHAFEARD
jgi:hypothetical protein